MGNSVPAWARSLPPVRDCDGARRGAVRPSGTMTTLPAESALAGGYEALATGDRARARDAFAAAVSSAHTPEALDGLGRSLWWLRAGREAIVYRERAYAGFRRDGELARAARIALWLAREYALVFETTLLREGGSRARSDCCKTSPPERSRAGSTSRGPSARSISKRGPDLPPARSMSRSRRTTSISSCGRSRSSASSRCPPETSMNRARRVPPDGGPRENRRGRHQEHGGGERLTRLDARAARELAHSRAALSDPSIRLPEASPGRVSAAALARRCRTPARCRARGPSRRGRRP